VRSAASCRLRAGAGLLSGLPQLEGDMRHADFPSGPPARPEWADKTGVALTLRPPLWVGWCISYPPSSRRLLGRIQHRATRAFHPFCVQDACASIPVQLLREAQQVTPRSPRPQCLACMRMDKRQWILTLRGVGRDDMFIFHSGFPPPMGLWFCLSPISGG